MWFRVPVLGIGILADQKFTADSLTSLGMSMQLDATKLDGDQVYDTVTHMLKTDSYREKAIEASTIIRSAGGASEGARLVERLAYIGVTDVFTPTSRKVPWWVSWQVDIFAALVGILVIAWKILQLCVNVAFGCASIQQSTKGTVGAPAGRPKKKSK